ncbi:MAG: hypothetical protein ACKORJ_10140 [Bacteroidota bacterium]
MTQPQGHSTSGSHERYKSAERLAWEKEFDCNRKMREFILMRELATLAEVEEIEREARESARSAKEEAWTSFMTDIMKEHQSLLFLLERASAQVPQIGNLQEQLEHTHNPLRFDAVRTARKALRFLRYHDIGHEACPCFFLGRPC